MILKPFFELAVTTFNLFKNPLGPFLGNLLGHFLSLLNCHPGTLDCAKLVSEVMSRNSPELLLLPTPNPESEFNTFITTEIRVRVDWSRIQESLKGGGEDSERERADETIRNQTLA